MTHSTTAEVDVPADEAPSIARLQDCLCHAMNSENSVKAVRAVARKVLRREPAIGPAAAEAREFSEMAAYLLAVKGVKQFVNLGCGFPAKPHLHETVQAAQRDTRTLYVDNDRVVMAHVNNCLSLHCQSYSGPAIADSLLADITEPETVLESPQFRDTIDLRLPVALILDSTWHFLPDPPDRPLRHVMAAYKEVVAPSSAIILTHLTSDFDPKAMGKAAAVLAEARLPIYPRSQREILDLVHGWRILPPAKQAPYRYLHPVQKAPADGSLCAAAYAVVARKPGVSEALR
ncbi:SAM-dependent methyltransferase [Streptomyces sp. NEAU-S7GS2]|uniref:SAM-dependent methyltransferase n=1 Tax=Streptomyces sp. NEAU-S7GS2 TaxID=2202000 RepID=UPI000D6FB6A9|nr:SAM-dependent methyltransferase [Streptomyces sp. NEAU-S7GS2]AWN24808.1 hypothetical protein DKG71_00210 [Streptomyces sp. NEAU-S7GS2]